MSVATRTSVRSGSVGVCVDFVSISRGAGLYGYGLPAGFGSAQFGSAGRPRLHCDLGAHLISARHFVGLFFGIACFGGGFSFGWGPDRAPERFLTMTRTSPPTSSSTMGINSFFGNVCPGRGL